ncbi:MAG: hypothetical protein ACK5JH_02695 [Anaerocolumna sp.]
MERYENIVKIEEIRRLIDENLYTKAAMVLDTMDINRIKSLTDLSIIADVLTQNDRYEEAMEILLKIYHKSKTRRVVYQLVDISIRIEDLDLANEYLRLYIKLAPTDSHRFIFRYCIDKINQEPYEILLDSLEQLKEYEYSETWAYELAKVYHKAGMKDKCVRECSDIILWFGEGVYVEKAKLLKAFYVGELNPVQLIYGKDKKEAMKQQLNLDKTKDYSAMREEINRYLAKEEAESIGESRNPDYEFIDSESDAGENIENNIENNSENDLENYTEVEAIAYEEDMDTQMIAITSEETIIFEQNIIGDAQGVDATVMPELGTEQGRYETNRINVETGIETETETDTETDHVVNINTNTDVKTVEVIDAVISALINAETEHNAETDYRTETAFHAQRNNITKTDYKTEIGHNTNTEGNADNNIESNIENTTESNTEVDTENTTKRNADNYAENNLDNTDEVSNSHESEGDIYSYLTQAGFDVGEEFGAFLLVEGLKEEIKHTLESILSDSNGINHLVIAGSKKSGRSTLAKKICRGLYALNWIKSPKIAMISGEKLNLVNLSQQKDKLRDTTIVIEKASQLSLETCGNLANFLEEMSDSVFVILEDEYENMEDILKNQDINKYFKNYIVLEKYTERDLFRFANEYIHQHNYQLLDEAKEAFFTNIKQLLVQGEGTLEQVIHFSKTCVEAADHRYKSQLADILNNRNLDIEDLLYIVKEDIGGIHG